MRLFRKRILSTETNPFSPSLIYCSPDCGVNNGNNHEPTQALARFLVEAFDRSRWTLMTSKISTTPGNLS
ncbi:hypothetical protein MCOR25_009916 [Pyricularia grisea]|uniref:Uncharacterized protein n=1 Tax=Pyricularia grisea TaxID=148305 RepID=A0A6P8B3V9_PYRGI|nr:hypothetical protein PgNI_06665 [Pyricularia grisea]KAI6351459.1 hypothetical protein MCOR25_009916 [Pyricularia grisea]TLD09992.1 hypothetical protein PgNI_06665 [Pyricularia grisea]